MTSKKKKIEKYAEAERIGQEENDSVMDDQAEESDPGKSTKKKENGDPAEALEKEAEAAKMEAKDNYDKFVRAHAELENFKKRITREMSDLRKYANEAILRDMLNVVDNLERAIESSNDQSENHSSIVEGVRMTLKGVLDLMEKYQVTAVESLGQPFDPRFHQAFQQEESEDQPDNTVVKEFQKGYLLHDRLLRPAMVIVSKNKNKPGAGDPKDDHVSENE